MREIFTLEYNENRIFGLDFLRALSILVVIVNHSTGLLPGKLQLYSSYLIFDGVSSFFVLSGFLIGGILIKLLEKNKDSVTPISLLFNFWNRRWLRTLPLYYLILLILIVYESFVNQNFKFDYRYFIFSQNIFTDQPKFFRESWSLSIEEWFYITIPSLLFCLIFIFKISVRKSFSIIIPLVIIGITLYRFLLFSNINQNINLDFYSIFGMRVSTRLDSLMFGVLGAFLSYYYPKIWHSKVVIKLFWIGLFIILLGKILSINNIKIFVNEAIFGSSIISFAILLLLPKLSFLKTCNKKNVLKITTYISLISYSMYLINLSLVGGIIIPYISKFFTFQNSFHNAYINYLSYWLIVIFGSILLYKYFELPFMNLRKKEK